MLYAFFFHSIQRKLHMWPVTIWINIFMSQQDTDSYLRSFEHRVGFMLTCGEVCQFSLQLSIYPFVLQMDSRVPNQIRLKKSRRPARAQLLQGHWRSCDLAVWWSGWMMWTFTRQAFIIISFDLLALTEASLFTDFLIPSWSCQTLYLVVLVVGSYQKQVWPIGSLGVMSLTELRGTKSLLQTVISVHHHQTL